MSYKEYTVRVYEDGHKEWRINGKLHREDGPAIEYPNGDKEWYINGKHHREDGPAIELHDGHKEWRINGELHREDGPAVEFTGGDTEWWLNDIELTEQEFNNRMKKNNCNGKIIEIEGVRYQLREVE